jgi:hypothetical protein
VGAWLENKVAAVSCGGVLSGSGARLASDCPGADVIVPDMADTCHVASIRDQGRAGKSLADGFRRRSDGSGGSAFVGVRNGKPRRIHAPVIDGGVQGTGRLKGNT